MGGIKFLRKKEKEKAERKSQKKSQKKKKRKEKGSGESVKNTIRRAKTSRWQSSMHLEPYGRSELAVW
jgi:hypothetical protein